MGLTLKKMGIVYAITNKLTGKIYFGETTRDGDTRFNEHRLALTNGKERNKPLQEEVFEIGLDGFVFEVIIETKEHKLCELVLIEIFSRIGLGYKQRRGDRIQTAINGELKIPKEVFEQIEAYINQNHDKSDDHLQLLGELKDIKEKGFQCKSDDIYNREFKNLFLDRYNNTTRRVDESRFRKAGRFEKQAQKDFYDFTFEEAEGILYSLNAKSVRSIQNHISRLRKYLDFAMREGVSKNKANYFDFFSKSEIVSKYLKTTVRSNSKDSFNLFE